MTNLSPAADAVLDAYMNNCGWLDGPLEKDYRCAAAVLRAAADQLTDASSAHTLYAIANELNGIHHLSLNQKIPTDS
jgi:hypothetical protein